jgi:hypothetical protein
MALGPAKYDEHKMTPERWKALKIYIALVLLFCLGTGLGGLAFSLLQSLGLR